ncbi:MAG: tRNA lysidine(34) synthetase TilS [Betaproteobacteria bacterium]|nr:tRNA lysidine(34) synthetase TilS [Betaproteobacteria bacterium]
MLLHVACERAASAGAAPPLAVHVHHGLQSAADNWAAHCAATATCFGAAFEMHRVSVTRGGGESLEAAARDARFAVFAALDVDALLLAHHRDDQAETVLFNALRGAGLGGLAGMPRCRPLAGGRSLLLRPFLDHPRAQLEAYAHGHGLQWIDDPSNQDTRWCRNLLRHEVLPPAERGLPQARLALARLAGHAAEAQRLADELADLDAASWTDDRGLRCRAFADLPAHRARNLLRRQLALAGLRMADAARLAEMLRQLSGDGCPEVLHEGHRITRKAGRLRIVPP